MKKLSLALAVAVTLSLAPAVTAASGEAPSVPSRPHVEALDRSPSRFATLEGRKVHFKVAGEGPATLVLVHGWTCDLTFWAEQLPLASRYRLLLVDLPGHGRSEAPAAWSMDSFARAVEAAMREAGVERAVLVGHSMGTPVIRQFWRLFPSKTLALVAVDGSLRSFFTDPAKGVAYADALAGEGGRTVFQKQVDGMMEAVANEAERSFIRSRMSAAPQATMAGSARAMFDPAIWKDDPVGVPILSILAPGRFWDEAYRSYVRTLSPAAEFVDVKGVSHFVMMEKPGEVNDALAGFVSRLLRPPAPPAPTPRTRG